MALKRVLMPMLLMGIILGLSGVVFGQVPTINCSISVAAATASTGVATTTGNNEPIAAGATGVPAVGGGGAMHVQCDNTGAGNVAFTAGVGVLTINLGVPITNNTGFPTNASAIRIGNVTGAFSAAGTCATANCAGIAGLTAASGTLVIGLGNGSGAAAGGNYPAGAPTLAAAPTVGVPWGAGQLGGFDIFGVLVAPAGKANVDATLSVTPGAGYVLGTTSIANAGAVARVIDLVTTGLKDPTVPTGALPAVVGGVGGVAVLSSNGTVVKGAFTIRIEENYGSMLKDATQFNGGATFPQAGGSDTAVTLQFNNVPAGFSIASCVIASTDTAGLAPGAAGGLVGAGLGGSPQLTPGSVSAAANTMTINFNGPLDQAATNVLWVTCTAGAGTAALPLPSTNITVQAYLAPTGTPLSGGATPAAQTGLTNGQIPRYTLTLQPTAPLAVVTFPASTTTLLVPFVTVGGGLDTGVAIANSTLDTFPAGFGGAAQSGTLTFTLYGNDATVKTYTTTTGAPGRGLTTAGVLNSGGTFSVNLSEIAGKAGATLPFQGYVIVTANFTNAHGAATIYSASTTGVLQAVLSTPVLVVPPPAAGPGGIRPTSESLGF